MSISKKSKSPRRYRKSKSRSPKKTHHRKSASRSLRKTHRKSASRSPKRSRSKSYSGYNWVDSSKFKKNSLGKYGYTTHANTQQRHVALEKAIKAYGAHSVWSKLNVVSILNKNRSPEISNVFTMDKNWVKKEFM